jgi:hypothetical protein
MAVEKMTSQPMQNLFMNNRYAREGEVGEVKLAQHDFNFRKRVIDQYTEPTGTIFGAAKALPPSSPLA